MQLPLLLSIGATATLAQLAMTRAYPLGNTLVVGSFAYATVGFSALYGSLLFHDRLTGQSWGGIGLTVRSAAKPSSRAAPGQRTFGVWKRLG